MMLWDFMYQILGITLIVTISFAIYKIFVFSNHDKAGISRTT